MKLIGYVIGGLVLVSVLIAVIAGIVLATFDPNDYKDDIITVVQDTTGRSLSLDGPISLTYYPVLGFSVQQAKMGNPEGFGAGEFASISELQAGVKVFPLLAGHIEFDSITLVDPVIHIIKKADGSTNLNFETAKADGEKTEAEKQKFSLSTGEIAIENATVHYDDRAARTETLIQPLNFSLSSFAFQKSSSVKLDAVIKQAASEIKISARTDAKINPDGNVITAKNLDADIDVKNEAMAKDISISLNGDVEARLEEQTARISGGKAAWGGTSIALEGDYGWAETQNANFKISAGNIDVDELMSAFSADAPAADTQKQAEAQATKESELPVEFLRALNANGTIEIASLKVAGLNFSDLSTTIKGEKGVMTFDPITLNLYGGSLAASGVIDARSGTLRVSEKGVLKDIQLAALLEDTMDEGYVNGKANVDYDISARGNSVQALIKSINGPIRVAVGEGYVTKWRLSQLINQAVAYAETGELRPNADNQVYFSSLEGTFTGNNGVLSNNDLTLIGPKAHALGGGQVNLAQNTINYTVRVGKGSDPEQFASARHFPVLIQGPLSSPQYGIDVQGVVQEQFGEKIEEKKQELLGKAFEKLGLGASKKEAAAPKDNATSDVSSQEAAPSPAESDDSSEGVEPSAGENNAEATDDNAQPQAAEQPPSEEQPAAETQPEEQAEDITDGQPGQ